MEMSTLVAPLFPTMSSGASGQDLSIWRTQFKTTGAGSELDVLSGEILDFVIKEKHLRKRDHWNQPSC